MNYLTAILTANNELFNSASDNDNDCSLVLGCMYVIIIFLTFPNDVLWNQFLSIIVEIFTFCSILLKRLLEWIIIESLALFLI